MSLFCDEPFGWRLKRPRGLRAAQEIYVDAPDLPMAELHVAGASSLVSVRRGSTTRLGDKRRRHNLRGAFSENSRLGRAYTVDIAHGINTRVLGFEGLFVHRNPVMRMRGHPRFNDDLRHTMHRDAKKKGVRHFGPVAEHGDLASWVEGFHEPVLHE